MNVSKTKASTTLRKRSILYNGNTTVSTRIRHPHNIFFCVCVSDFDMFSQLLPGPKKSISHFSAQWQIWMKAEVKQLRSLAVSWIFLLGQQTPSDSETTGVQLLQFHTVWLWLFFFPTNLFCFRLTMKKKKKKL